MTEKGPSVELRVACAADRALDRLDFALRSLRETTDSAERPAPPAPAPCGPAPEFRSGGDSRGPSLSPQQRRAALAVALGNAHFGAGALESAEREYRDALAADPGNADAHTNLALTLARLGRLDEAEQQLLVAEAAGTLVSPLVGDEIRERRSAGNPSPALTKGRQPAATSGQGRLR